jgi:hypothetical protein
MGVPEVCGTQRHASIRTPREGNGEASVMKPESRSWWRRFWSQRAALPLGLLLLTVLGGGAVWLRLQLAIERCVDAGGKWASLDRRCTFVEPEVPEPMLARPATPVKATQ